MFRIMDDYGQRYKQGWFFIIIFVQVQTIARRASTVAISTHFLLSWHINIKIITLLHTFTVAIVQQEQQHRKCLWFWGEKCIQEPVLAIYQKDASDPCRHNTTLEFSRWLTWSACSFCLFLHYGDHTPKVWSCFQHIEICVFVPALFCTNTKINLFATCTWQAHQAPKITGTVQNAISERCPSRVYGKIRALTNTCDLFTCLPANQYIWTRQNMNWCECVRPLTTEYV